MAITRSQQARQMLKEAGFVVQDGFKNYIKNSESVTVPKEFKSKEDATPTKLAYITKDEAKMLKKMKKGTPHKGPKGIPSYDDYDAETGSLFKIFESPKIFTPFFSTVSSACVNAVFPPCAAAKS